MDKYVIANGVSLDEGNSTMRASSGGTRGGKRWYEDRVAPVTRGKGREGACEEGRRAAQAKETQWEAQGG